MANPRQRRKARSSAYKPVRSTNARNLRKKPPIKGPEVLQRAWDKTKTVRQNYAALGLVANPNAALKGGQGTVPSDEPNGEMAAGSFTTTAPSAAVKTRTNASSIPKGKGRLIRDASGKVIGVDLPEDDDGDDEEGMDVDEASPDDASRRQRGAAANTTWGTPMPDDRPVVPVSAKTSVVRELEVLAASGAGQKKPRALSEHQAKWLDELIAVHGDDVGAMARDRKRNVWQRTSGEIRRMLAQR